MKEYLTKEQVEENADYFKSLLKKYVNRDGANVDRLIQKLESSDFFYAPASTQYHGSFYGGLCAHSICVFENLVQLVENKLLITEPYELNSGTPLFETVVILGLLHDVCKMNRYIMSMKNVKRYHVDGKQHDSIGNYDWESVSSYQVKPSDDRFVFGTDGETSEYIIRQFIPLSVEESIAIINSKGDTESNSNTGISLATIFSKYNLPVLLHCADLMACYVDDLTKEKSLEKYDEQNVVKPTEAVQKG